MGTSLLFACALAPNLSSIPDVHSHAGFNLLEVETHPGPLNQMQAGRTLIEADQGEDDTDGAAADGDEGEQKEGVHVRANWCKHTWQCASMLCEVAHGFVSVCGSERMCT